MRTVKLPVHLALIMDGNGRWATRRLRPRAYGHKAGVQNMFRICGHAFHLGVRIVTVFALSAETSPARRKSWMSCSTFSAPFSTKRRKSCLNSMPRSM